MGLFDFLNKKPNKKLNQLMFKMNQEIFPGGAEQITDEVNELHDLLGRQYSQFSCKFLQFF